MTLRRIRPRVLVVEGQDEKRVFPELLELAGIPWPKGNEPVDIEERDGIDNILEVGFIETTLKASGVQAVGIVVDANGDPTSRWQQLRSRLAESYPEFPVELPAAGVIYAAADKTRVGHLGHARQHTHRHARDVRPRPAGRRSGAPRSRARRDQPGSCARCTVPRHSSRKSRVTHLARLAGPAWSTAPRRRARAKAAAGTACDRAIRCVVPPDLRDLIARGSKGYS